MSRTILALIFIFSSTALAKDYQLTKGEFLSRLDSGNLSLEKAPIVAAHPNMVQQLIDSQKKEFPGFKEEMFYTAYTKSTNYTYFIFYEWYDRGCIFGITEPKKFTNASSDEARGELATKEKNSYEKIDSKYCEKALGISVPSGGLVKIPNAIKPIKPKGK